MEIKNLNSPKFENAYKIKKQHFPCQKIARVTDEGEPSNVAALPLMFRARSAIRFGFHMPR